MIYIHTDNPTNPTSPVWNWPEGDNIVDLSPLVLRESKAHDGDSPKLLARPRKKRGAATVPQTAYIVKVGRDAIGERMYYLAARMLNIPSAVVFWADDPGLPETAIRFEGDAWKPAKLDMPSGIATLGERRESLRNPLDYYRHLALSDVLGEYDGTEFMVRDGTLFRIDAAYVGWSLFHLAMGEMFSDAHVMSLPTQVGFGLNTVLDGYVARMKDEEPIGYTTYWDTLRAFVNSPQLADKIIQDLLACPGAEGMHQEFKLPNTDAMLVMDMPRVARAMHRLMEHQQATLEAYLAAHK